MKMCTASLTAEFGARSTPLALFTTTSSFPVPVYAFGSGFKCWAKHSFDEVSAILSHQTHFRGESRNPYLSAGQSSLHCEENSAGQGILRFRATPPNRCAPA